MDETAGMGAVAGQPADRHDIIAVRVTIEYQFATKAAHRQSVLHFKEGVTPADVRVATEREAGIAVEECVSYVAAALGAGRAGT